ncbi:28S ribosomal protein S6, mitochondrial [Branchiostoma belcheri]|nr:28S ribosomal protein S6, mitochondrial [Branchiostoma belcheri]
MPRYELVMITKALERPETVTVVKRAVQSLLEKGGIVRQIENLGERRLPYIMRAHSENFTQGRYFVVEFDGPTTLVSSMTQLLNQDLDIIRPNIIKKEEWSRKSQTITHLTLQRGSVQKMSNLRSL